MGEKAKDDLPNEDDVLRRMLKTPPTPHKRETLLKDRVEKRRDKPINGS